MLFQQIKETRMKYLGKDSTAFGILGLVISEVQRTNLSSDVPDKQVAKVVKTLLESVTLSIANGTKHSIPEEKMQKLNRELEVLNAIELPKEPEKLSKDELEVIINNVFSAHPEWKNLKGKGQLFAFLKSNYPEKYDGQVVNDILGTLL